MRNVFKQFAIALMLTVGVALTLGAATATAQAATPETKRVSVTGEIVDTWCNVTMIMFAEGSGHYQCAVWCAAGGIPVSIKDEDENVYVVLKVEGEESNVAAPSILRIQAH
jgi:type 1 fimbria pilin